MGFERQQGQGAWFAGAMAGLLADLLVGCGGSAEGPELVSDAAFNPPSAATAFRAVDEGNPAVAQTFTVGQDGRLEQFSFVLTDGESADDGTVQVTIQPVSAGGVIDDDPNNSLIDPILVDTATLPEILVEEFTDFDIGMEPGRDVLAGERYAIVVEFVSRDTDDDTDAIARVLGQLPAPGDPYAGGTGATGELEVGFTNNTEDYFFETVIQTQP